MKAGGRATSLLRPSANERSKRNPYCSNLRGTSRKEHRTNSSSAQPLYRRIKLALDVHAGDLMVARMVDGAKAQPPQKMTQARFLEWVAKQKVQAKEVVSCFEAGPTGFWLHRQLTALGGVEIEAGELAARTIGSLQASDSCHRQGATRIEHNDRRRRSGESRNGSTCCSIRRHMYERANGPLSRSPDNCSLTSGAGRQGVVRQNNSVGS